MKLTLNLASRSYLNRRALYTFYVALSAALVLLLIMNLMFFLRSQAHVRQIRSHMSELDQDLIRGRDLAQTFNQEDYEKLIKEIAFANDLILKDSFRWTKLFGQLESVVPDGVIIQGLQPDFKEHSLSITGLARQVTGLRRFMANLLADGAFGKAFLLQQAQVTIKESADREYDAISFSILVKGAF